MITTHSLASSEVPSNSNNLTPIQPFMRWIPSNLGDSACSNRVNKAVGFSALNINMGASVLSIRQSIMSKLANVTGHLILLYLKVMDHSPQLSHGFIKFIQSCSTILPWHGLAPKPKPPTCEAPCMSLHHGMRIML